MTSKNILKNKSPQTLFLVAFVVVFLIVAGGRLSNLAVEQTTEITEGFSKFRGNSQNDVNQNETSKVLDTADITEDDKYLVIKSTSIPNHETGIFPNDDNPYEISEQSSTYYISRTPEINGFITNVDQSSFGIALNGITFDPATDRYWNLNSNSIWQYEAISPAINIGLDENYAHVHPSGKYHYHGIPTSISESLDEGKHSQIVGYAADGFPIYVLYGFDNPHNPSGGVVKIKSSYILKQGSRPDKPGGKYDGSFTNDYLYRSNQGHLDECNGRFGVTPEFSKGTYHYFLTEDFPIIPRCLKGTPHKSFSRD